VPERNRHTYTHTYIYRLLNTLPSFASRSRVKRGKYCHMTHMIHDHYHAYSMQVLKNTVLKIMGIKKKLWEFKKKNMGIFKNCYGGSLVKLIKESGWSF